MTKHILSVVDAPVVHKNAETPVAPAQERYVHPFNLVPHVTQPEFDTRFRTLPQQRAARMDALLQLAALTTLEHGDARTTDRWLAIARQNVRDMDGHLGVFEEERASMIGLSALYLTSNRFSRNTDEADVYATRIERAEAAADNAYISGNPHRQAHLAIKASASVIAHKADGSANIKNPTIDAVAENIIGSTESNPESPEFLQAKAQALFEYASTMLPCSEKRGLLSEAMNYADETFARAEGDAHELRAAALHTLARALHDVSYIPHSFAPNNDASNRELAIQARNYSVALLQQATLESQLVGVENSRPNHIINSWTPQGDVEGIEESGTAYDDARYFQSAYGAEVRDQGIYRWKTPDIERLIANSTATKFGHQLVLHVFEEQYTEPVAA